MDNFVIPIAPRASKADGVVRNVTVDFNALPEAMQANVINYGLRQKLNDAGSQVPGGDDKLAAAEACYEQMTKGIWAERRAGASADPLEVRVRKLARKEVVAMIKNAGKKVSEFETAQINAAVDTILTQGDNEKRWTKQAKAEIEAEQNQDQGAATEALGDLGL